MPIAPNKPAAKKSKVPATRARAAAARQVAKREAARGPGKIPSDSADRANRLKKETAKRGRLTRVTGASPSPSIELRKVAETVRTSDTNTLVLVHSPMCGHCLRMRPAFDLAARSLVGNGVQVVEIESSAMNSAMRDGNPLVQALGEGYVGVPHLVLFGPRASWKRPYAGDRSTTSLLSFSMPSNSR
jgi:thiol-disulfide isomerase/thioredoxin